MLEFAYGEKPIDMMLPTLRHVTLTNPLDLPALISSLPSTVRSLHILLYCRSSRFVAPDWNGLRSLASLPSFHSLRVLFYDMKLAIDQTTCQIMAQAVTQLNNVAILFRPAVLIERLPLKSMVQNQRASIGNLLRHVLLLSIDRQPLYAIEQGGCGLSIWFV